MEMDANRKFLSLEDLTGTYEAVLFPEVHRRTASLTLDGGPLLLEGRVEESFGVTSLTVSRLRPLPAFPGIKTR